MVAKHDEANSTKWHCPTARAWVTHCGSLKIQGTDYSGDHKLRPKVTLTSFFAIHPTTMSDPIKKPSIAEARQAVADALRKAQDPSTREYRDTQLRRSQFPFFYIYIRFG
jgi:hypothetical protein